PLAPRSTRLMNEEWPPSWLEYFACNARSDACASASLVCEDTCTARPAVLVVPVAMSLVWTAAVRGASGCGARCGGAEGCAEALSCGSSESGLLPLPRVAGGVDFAAGADRDVAGAPCCMPPTGRPLRSLPSGLIVTVRIRLASPPPGTAPVCAGAAGGCAAAG